jgi:hypothetical protein
MNEKNKMDNENKSIHEFNMNLICECFSRLERRCPGSSEMTIKALSFIDNLTAESYSVFRTVSRNSRSNDFRC